MSNLDYVKSAAAGIVAGAIGVVVVWLLAAAISPELYAKTFGSDKDTHITIGTAIFVTVLYGVIGSVVGWLLFWKRKPRTWWYAIAAIVIILTTIEALVQARTTETAIWLILIHLAAAAAIVPAVARTLPED